MFYIKSQRSTEKNESLKCNKHFKAVIFCNSRFIEPFKKFERSQAGGKDKDSDRYISRALLGL